MRVHNEITITRRENIQVQTSYEKYRETLRQDFFNICGYCGKHETHTTKGFEIDHFVPDRIDSGRKNDYYNLVYSCMTCNRKKGKKWPTEDKKVHNKDDKGFVDPATADYDVHLSRDDNGAIIGKTELGNYICKEIFKFNLRPTELLYKFQAIEARLKKIEKLIASLSLEDAKVVIKAYQAAQKIREIIFEKKE